MSTTNKEIKTQIRNIYNSLCSEVKCSICLDLYTEPVTLTTCSHTFCKECYMSLFISLTSPQTILCPICKRAVKRREYFEDQRAQSLVKFLKVYDGEILQKLDQCGSDKTDRMKRNEIKFVSAMESTNKVQRWINSCMQENTRHSDFFLTSSDDSDSEDFSAIPHTNIDNLSKLFEPELARKPTHKKLVVRRTKSLTNIISRVKRKQTKRHSTGNLQLPSEEIIVIEEYDSADVDNSKKEQNNILNLLEEDVLKNFEMEMFGYAKENIENYNNNSNKLEEALDNSNILKNNIKTNYNVLMNGKTPTKNINKMSATGESSAKNLNISSEISISSKNQKTLSDKGNHSARKRSRNTKNDEISIDTGEISFISTTPWSRMKTMNKEINKSDIKKKAPKYKQLNVSMEVTKPVSKRKKVVKEQMETAVNNQVRNETVFENINSQEINRQSPISQESIVANLDDFETYLNRNMLQNKTEENTKPKLHVEADTNENSGSSEEDDIFSISTQKLILDELPLNSLDDKTEIQITTNKRNPMKDKIVKDDQDENIMPSAKINKARIMDKNATTDEQTPKRKYKKVKVSTSDKKHDTNAQNMNKGRITDTNEKNQADVTKKDEKQQIIVNNLDEIQPCSPADVNNYRKPFLTEFDGEENVETNNFISDIQVHRSLNGSSYIGRLNLIDFDHDPKVLKYNQDENLRHDLDYISDTYDSSKNIHSRKSSVNRKAEKKNKMRDAIVVLENDDKTSVTSTNQNSDGVMSTSSKEDQLNSTNPKRALLEINQNKEISATASQILNKKVTDSENDIIGGSETSNIRLDNVPVRRSRKSNSKAKIIKEQPTNKENKTHKQFGILQQAINKWNETSSESSTDVQDELKAGFKSMLDQRNTMAANLQNSLNLNNTVLSQLSNYLTNSESLFSQSSTNKEEIEQQCSDLDDISDKPNFNLAEYFLSLPHFSDEEQSRHNVHFYNTAIPYLDNINKLYHQIVSLSSQVKNETENFTNIFSKSLLTNCDSSKNNSNSSQINLSTVNKDSTIVNLESVINKNNSAITNLELALNKNTSVISNSAKSNNLELEVNKTNIVRDVSIQTDVINCPKCSYIFDFNSKVTSTSPNVDILLPPIEFTHVNDLDNIRTKNSQTMPILNINNISESCKDISPASTNNQSSYNSEIKVGKKINRQLFASSDESENNKKRKFKRIRTPTSDSDSQPMNAKKSKQEKLYHSRLLYRDDLDIEFDSEMTDSNEKNLQKPTKVTGDSEIENYDEYMKKLFVKYDRAIEGEEDDIICMEIDEEVVPNNIRTVDERTKIGTRSTSKIKTKEISNNSRTKTDIEKINTPKNKMTNSTRMRTRSNKVPKDDTQEITAKYVDILEQEFKTAQFTKPEPKPVTKTIQDTEVRDHFESIPNSVLDNLLTDVSFANAANSTLVGKSADKSQIAAAISFESTANATIVEKSEEKLQTSLFATPNKSVCGSKKADDTCYTHDIIPATMLSEMDNRNIRSSKNVNTNIALGIRELDLVLATTVRDNVDEADLNNEVANITGSHPLEDSIGSDKDIFDGDDDNIVESTPQKESPSQRDRSKFELSTNLQNSIVEFIKPSENINSEWLNNIAPPPEFQDTEQRDCNTSLQQQSASGVEVCRTPDIISMNPNINNSALNKGFNGSNLDISLENSAKSNHSNIGNIASQQLSKPVLTNHEKISSQQHDKPYNNKPVLEPATTGWLSNTRNLNPLVLAQKNTFSPLKIVNPSPPPRPAASGTPKQKSILNYMCTSQKVESMGRPDATARIDYKSSPITANIPTFYPPQLKEIMQCASQTKNSNSNSISMLNVSRMSRNTCTITPSKEFLNKNTSIVSNVETPKYSVCIACTRLKRDETAAILSLTAKLHGRYSKEFSKQVTHLVVAVDQTNKVKDHTIKYVLAISHGVWVVSFAWIKDCLNHNRYVNEEPYEVLDVSGRPGPRLSRLTRITQPLLKNYVINCAEPFTSVSKTDLENAIISLGGEIKQSFTELQNEKDKIRLILSEAKVTQDYDQYQIWRATYKILVVDIEWLSRTVGQYQVASVRPFVLCIEEDIEDLGYPYPLIAQVPETPTQLTETFNIHQQH